MTIQKSCWSDGSTAFIILWLRDLDINCKKKNKQKQKQTKDGMDPRQIFYAEDEPLVKACNERENIRELTTHIGEGRVQLSSVH